MNKIEKMNELTYYELIKMLKEYQVMLKEYQVNHRKHVVIKFETKLANDMAYKMTEILDNLLTDNSPWTQYSSEERKSAMRLALHEMNKYWRQLEEFHIQYMKEDGIL